MAGNISAHNLLTSAAELLVPFKNISPVRVSHPATLSPGPLFGKYDGRKSNGELFEGLF